MIETIGDFKKQVKLLTKSAIKTKLFGGADGVFNFKVIVGPFDKKAKVGKISLSIQNEPIAFKLESDVNTRVYNKINAEFFAPIAGQYDKLKGVKDINFNIE